VFSVSCVVCLLSLIAPPVIAAPVNPFAENVRPTSALTPEQELKSFHLPPGFTIQLVAAEPEIHKPINIELDARGRLWVTSTIEYPFPVRDPKVKPRDMVKVLEIDPATGRATKVTDFADGLNIPAGVYPYKNGCIAFSIPNIYFLQDTDGDGVCDKRDVLYGPFDTTRDVHGLNNSFIRGYDGYLYATHGFNNQSHITAKDGSTLSMNSGNIYRMTLDGSHVDHIAHGPVNPFGLMFDTAGQLWLADCHTKPFQMVLRGAWFEHFGRPHDGIGFYPKIMGHLHGSTAIGGVVVIEDDRWPAEFRHNLLCGNPVTSRVDRDSATWSGSTPAAHEQPDFVASDDPWFRPVAFAFAPDGSIYMADFYNKIIGHYEVPLTHPGRDRTSGRIWRIVPPREGAGARVQGSGNAAAIAPSPGTPGDGRGEGFALGTPLPDLTKLSAPDLVKTLAHPNITARMLASDQLTDRIGTAAIEPCRAILSTGTPTQKVHALWVLYRLGAVQPNEIVAAAKDADAIVRGHAVRVLEESRELSSEQRRLLIDAMRDENPLVRRNAAEALGLHPAAEDLRPLLDLIDGTDKADTHLIYVGRIALRGHLEAPGLLAGLAKSNLSDADKATIDGVLPAVNSAQAAAFIIDQLRAGTLAGGPTDELLKHAARWGGDEGTQAAAAFAQQRLASNDDQALEALQAIHSGLQERGATLPPALHDWAVKVVTTSLAKGAKDARRAQAAADLAKSLALKACAAPLAALMADGKADVAARLAAVTAVLALDKSNVPAVAAVVADPKQPANLREAAAKALSEANTDEARQALIMPIRVAPQAVAAKLAAALAGRPEGANTLMDAIERNNLSARLLQEPIVRDKLAAAKVRDLDGRISKLTANLAPANAALDKLIALKKKAFDAKTADAARGQQVFTRTCAVCHQIAGQGAVVGPQLDGVGARGLDRLLEDVIDPNRNVDPMFRFSNVTLKDGDTISGLVRSQTDATLTLVDVTGHENAIDKKEVDRVEVSKLSLMPTGFGELLSPAEFNDLVAFLLSHSAARQP
jgi:putative heme-binding domain-containing protein